MRFRHSTQKCFASVIKLFIRNILQPKEVLGLVQKTTFLYRKSEEAWQQSNQNMQMRSTFLKGCRISPEKFTECPGTEVFSSVADFVFCGSIPFYKASLSVCTLCWLQMPQLGRHFIFNLMLNTSKDGELQEAMEWQNLACSLPK